MKVIHGCKLNILLKFVVRSDSDNLCLFGVCYTLQSFGHYSSLSKLLEHNAHLAVFMNYVIDNRCDPSSLVSLSCTVSFSSTNKSV